MCLWVIFPMRDTEKIPNFMKSGFFETNKKEKEEIEYGIL